MKKTIGILLLCFCTALNVIAQNGSEKAAVPPKKVFRTIPAIPKQGDKVQIVYDPSLNGVAADVPVKGSFYLFKDFKWQGYDLAMVKSDSGYTGSCEIPAGAAMLACRFAIGDSIDRGGRFPYALVLHQDEQMAPGAYTEWGLVRSKDAAGQMSPLVSTESLIEPKVLVQLWVAKEFNNLKVRRKLFFDAALGIKAYFSPEKADSILRKAGAEIASLPDVTEKELMAVENVFRSVVKDKTLADSLKTVILAKYPDGIIKRLQVIRDVYTQADKDLKIQQWNSFTKTFPFSGFPYEDYADITIAERSFFINSYVSVANIAFMKHDLEQVGKLVAVAPLNLVGYFYDHYVVFPFRHKESPVTEKEALEMSIAFTNVLFKRIDAASLADRGIFAPLEWRTRQMRDNANVWASHAELLYKNGQYDAALKMADKVKPYLGYRFISFNTIYVKLLDHFRKTSQVMAYSSASIKANTASPELIDLFKAAYIKEHGSAKGFDASYEALRPGGKLKEAEDRLKASMVRIPAINFNLKNIQGQLIDLEKQKGKIVVLDFWASWCFPCKAAMPGMQTLVHKYEPSGDVSFFFIATLEESADYKKLINDFLAVKKYDFNVLYDEMDVKSKRLGLTFNSYASLLKLSGIPQKIIIDQHGIVRWVSGGFSGDLVELTDEVSYVIDLLKKEKS